MTLIAMCFALLREHVRVGREREAETARLHSSDDRMVKFDTVEITKRNLKYFGGRKAGKKKTSKLSRAGGRKRGGIMGLLCP